MMENGSKFWRALCDPAARPFAVELDSPAGPEVSQFMAGARELQAHGAELITVADCPMGRVRADAGIMACKLKRELGMESLPHMSCRDRNWIAVQSLLFGFVAEGIENMLLVTGARGLSLHVPRASAPGAGSGTAAAALCRAERERAQL